MEHAQKGFRPRISSAETPIADALMRLSKTTRHSFHALPILHGNSLHNCPLKDKYESLFGDRLTSIELTATGKHFDSFFFPDGFIRKAEDLAAEAFGSDGCLFVTTGTSTSNKIALHALYQPQMRVLLDRTCHLSMHVSLQELHASVDYISPQEHHEDIGASYWSLDELLNTLLTSQQNGKPHDIVILNGQSYDGVMYDIPAILRYLLDNGVTARRFLIDEAWSSANYFSRVTRKNCAMSTTELLNDYPELVIISTQSAHKSLSSLRQASMIHFRGKKEWREVLYAFRFRIHTTSPSYPILASIDLARAQMHTSGTKLTAESLRYAHSFKHAVLTDPAMDAYTINHPAYPKEPFAYIYSNPSKISLNISGTGLTPEAFCDKLLNHYGIYINRSDKDSVLLNFHIGINSSAFEHLLYALKEIGRHAKTKKANLNLQPESISQSYIISYPPGVPLVVPGEQLNQRHCEAIEAMRHSGKLVIQA